MLFDLTDWIVSNHRDVIVIALCFAFVVLAAKGENHD